MCNTLLHKEETGNESQTQETVNVEDQRTLDPHPQKSLEEFAAQEP